MSKSETQLVQFYEDAPCKVTRISSGHRFTEAGNAERFIFQHGENLRYVSLWNKWLVWDDKRWAKDSLLKIDKLAQQTADSICAEAAQFTGEQRKEAFKHATRSESASAIKALIHLARNKVSISPDKLDRWPMLLNVRNGTIDLKTGVKKEHKRDNMLTQLADIECREADCPRWLEFLDTVFGGNQELINYTQRAVGYTLTGRTDEQCLFFLYGSGANGKSTFISTVQHILGDYAKVCEAKTLLVDKGSGISNDIAALRGARMVVGSELEDGKRFAESRIKDLTGGDRVSARFLYSESFEFRPQFKLWMFGNHKPDIRGTDEGIWRRIHLVPFAVQIPPSERDQKLPEKLAAEASGILSWAITGCLDWQEGGLNAPAVVRDATQEYREEQDVLGAWISERCDERNNTEATGSALFADYQKWALGAGEHPTNRNKFGAALVERGFTRRKASSVRYLGIALKSSDLKDIYDN